MYYFNLYHFFFNLKVIFFWLNMNLIKLSFYLYLNALVYVLLLATTKLRHWNDCITKCRLHVYAVPVLVSLILFLKKSCKVSKPIVSLSCLCVEVSCKTVPLRKKILLTDWTVNNFFSLESYSSAAMLRCVYCHATFENCRFDVTVQVVNVYRIYIHVHMKIYLLFRYCFKEPLAECQLLFC